MTVPQMPPPPGVQQGSPYGPYPRLGIAPQPFPQPPPRYASDPAPDEPKACLLCGGKHALPSTPACPRLASFEVDGDGHVKSGTFWKGKGWAEGRVVLAEDEAEGDGDEPPDPR